MKKKHFSLNYVTISEKRKTDVNSYVYLRILDYLVIGYIAISTNFQHIDYRIMIKKNFASKSINHLETCFNRN